jgi:hypothetical protein
MCINAIVYQIYLSLKICVFAFVQYSRNRHISYHIISYNIVRFKMHLDTILHFTYIVWLVTFWYHITFLHISFDWLHFDTILHFTYIVWLATFWYHITFYIYRFIGYILIPYYIFTYIVLLATFWYVIVYQNVTNQAIYVKM